MLIGHGPSGVAHDFFVYNAANEVWNGSGFVPWNDADFISYRVAATELGTSGRFVSNVPVGTDHYELRIRGATLATSVVTYYSNLYSLQISTGVEEMKGHAAPGTLCDFFAFNSSNQVYSISSGTFVAWTDGNYVNYRIPAVESGASGLFIATAPVGTETYELRLRGASVATSPVLDSGVVDIVTDLPTIPGAPEQTTGYLYVFNNLGIAQAGVLITCTVADVHTQIEEGGLTQISGVAIDRTPRQSASDVNGAVFFSGLFKGVAYVFQRGTGRPQTVLIPLDTGSSFQLPVLTGTP